MRKIFISFTIFIAIVCANLSFFCLFTSSNDSHYENVTILLDWTPNVNHTGIYVAQKLGYFKDETLNVKIEQPPQESSTALVAAEKVEFAVAFQDFLAPAFTSDTPLPVKAVAAIAQHNSAGIICKKSAHIQTFSDLEFKNYSTFDNFIELALLKYCVKISGGNFDNVNLIHAQTDNIAAALGTNIDAAWGYFGIESIIASHFNIENNFIFFRDIDPILDYYTPILISNINYTKNNPETVKKVLRALSKGYIFAAKHPKKAASILTECVPELNYKIILESQKYLSTIYVNEDFKWGQIDPVRWDNFYDWLFDNHILNKKIPHGSTFTNAFLPD